MAKQRLRHHRIYRDGKQAWTKTHIAWVRAQRLDDPLAQLVLAQMLVHFDAIDSQLSTFDAGLVEIACDDPVGRPSQRPERLTRDLDVDRARVDR